MNLSKLIKTYPDFPHKGIQFKDITPIVNDGETYFEVMNQLKLFIGTEVEYVAGIESRGFYFVPLSFRVRKGFIPIRKQGKLPGPTWKQFCGLEYGECYLEIQKDVIKLGEKVVIVDDILATGGTALASAKLIEQAGGKVSGFLFVGEIKKLKGRNKLKGYAVHSLVML